jgi:hypothetical protein
MFSDGSLVMDLGALIELGRGHRCWGRVRRIVRRLQNDEELQAAVERARAFERRGVDRGQQRVVNYDRHMREGRSELANVVQMDSSRSTELLAELGIHEAPATQSRSSIRS